MRPRLLFASMIQCFLAALSAVSAQESSWMVVAACPYKSPEGRYPASFAQGDTVVDAVRRASGACTSRGGSPECCDMRGGSEFSDSDRRSCISVTALAEDRMPGNVRTFFDATGYTRSEADRLALTQCNEALSAALPPENRFVQSPVLQRAECQNCFSTDLVEPELEDETVPVDPTEPSLVCVKIAAGCIN